MAISEKVELLGKGLYEDIPDTLTLTSMPTASELDYVGSEDFEKTMIRTILPAAVQEEGIDFSKLLEIDFQWLCRCLRLLNYGPYFTTNAVFCRNCGQVSYGEYRVNLETIACKPLPDGFVNDIVIKREEFIDFDGDIHVKLPTIQQMMNARKDKAFQKADGTTDLALARMCYMISSFGNKKSLTPVDIKLAIQKDLSPADYIILQETVKDLTDYGLRIGGITQCPKCGDKEASFMALTDDKFFRPTVGDLREWKNIRSSGQGKKLS